MKGGGVALSKKSKHKSHKKDGDKPNAMISDISENTALITSIGNEQGEIYKRYSSAIASYNPNNKAYSAYLKFTDTPSKITRATIEMYGENAQTDINKVMNLNAMVRLYANIDDLIGMVVQSITNNINTKYTLSWNNFGGQRNKTKMLNKTKRLIENFNNQIDIKQLIRDAVEMTYLEGNFNCLLKNQDGDWTIDYLPLGVCEISDYLDHGRPILLMNMNKLKEGLSKIFIRDSKGQPIFFKNTDEEIDNVFIKEIIDGYNSRNNYVRLDPAYTGTCRINNRCRNYGISPVVRALTSAIMLTNFYDADTVTAKAKSKKIIHQILRKDVMGSDGQRKGIEEMAYAHSQLMEAWKNPTVVYTSAPAVEKIVYVEPQTEEISPEKVRLYRNKVLSSLGVSFLTNDNSQTASTAHISLKQLLQCINRISEQIERMLENFYRTVLTVNGIDLMYCPTIEVIDSEMLEGDMKIAMSQFLYGTLNCSRETAYNMVGINVEDEMQKRVYEQQQGYDEIFVAHPTAYTKSADSNDTDKKTDNEEKQSYDKEYNKTRVSY